MTICCGLLSWRPKTALRPRSGARIPAGLPVFVAAMNQKAMELGMFRTRFVDSSGLSSDNVSTAEDLAKMVAAAHTYPLIQQFTTLTQHAVHFDASGRHLLSATPTGS